MKRCFDFFVSMGSLILLLPILMSIFLAILFFDGWPVFFMQERLGLHGRPFKLLKFRSMKVEVGSERGTFDLGNRMRVTRIGSFIRKTKIDELPQLVNVLKGEMSIVGPRPEVKQWVNAFPDRWRFVHSVRPGITDPASIVFRNEEALLSESDQPERMYREKILPAKLDLYDSYIKNQSFIRDLKIILRTVFAVFRG